MSRFLLALVAFFAVSAVHAEPGVLRAHPIAAELQTAHQAVAALRAGKPSEMQLELFADAAFTLRFHRTEVTRDGSDTLFGRVDGDPYSSAIVVIKRGAVSANILTRSRMFQVRYRGGGAHEAREVDSSGRRDMEPDPPAQAPTSKAAAPITRATTMIDDGSLIDLLVLYTADSRIGASPDDEDDAVAIQLQVNLAVAETNAAYERSGVTQRLRLVHMAETPYVPTGHPPTDLARLQASADGFVDEAHTLRDTYGADLVSLWIENLGGTGGAADIMATVSTAFAPQAFSIIERRRATDTTYALAHFLGRNMGVRPDVFVDNATTPYPYAHGYVDVAHLFRDIMGMNDACFDAEVDCIRIPYFGNPSVNYNGFPTGNASNANAAATLNQTAFTVANFRATVAIPGVLSFSPSAYTVNEFAGAATLSVARTLDTSGAVSVQYSTVNGTATSGSDYTATTGTLSWTHGEGGSKSFAVPINNDGANEGNETFTVTLSNPTGGASLGTATASVNILESTEDAFPRNCALPAGWVKPSGAAASWEVDTSESTEGHCSLRSSAVGNSQMAQIEFTGTFQSGNITFKRKVSSELDYDCFRFYIGTTQMAVGGTCTETGGTGASGELGWQLVTVPVTAGTRTLKWSFERDFSDGFGANAAWIDEVVLPIAVTVNSVVSRKTHGSAGALELTVDAIQPVTGPVTVDSRMGPGHAIVFKFNGNVMSAGTATTTDHLGAPIGSASTSLSGNDIVVTLAGIADGKRVKVSLTNVNNLGTIFSPSIGFLLGDADGNRVVVSPDDITAVKAQTGKDASAATARYDFNLSGAVTATDILIAKGRIGNAL